MDRLLTAADFMVKQVVTLRPEAGVLDGIRRLVDNGITGAPVLDAANGYLGIFSEKRAMDGILQAAEAQRGEGPGKKVVARDIMQTALLTLSPKMDAIAAIDSLLSHRISGAPVIDESGLCMGVFSEKTSMSVILGAAYESLPDTNVEAFMNVDPGRVLSDEETDLPSLAKIFLETPYRRLLVLREGKVAGMIGRRDVLRAALRLNLDVPGYLRPLQQGSGYSIGAAMDCHAAVIPSDFDILQIATIFLETPYRRLPVLEGRSLVGLVSRRDLLAAARGILNPKVERRTATPLYLSALAETRPPT